VTEIAVRMEEMRNWLKSFIGCCQRNRAVIAPSV